MSTQLKLRRGTTAQHSTFTGASGEVTVDTDKKAIVVHDGSTAGGYPQVSNQPTTRPSIRPSLLLDFANTKQLDPRVTFSRASTAAYYDGKTVVKAEENLLLQSQDFDNAAWGKTDVTVTANTTTAPDGTTTADTLTAANTNTNHEIFQAISGSCVSGATYAMSAFVKAGTNNYYQMLFGSAGFGTSAYANFDISTGVLGTVGSSATASITSIGGGWYRCVLIATATASGTFWHDSCLITSSTSARLQAWAAAGTETVYIWGAQLEQRSTLTAYTPTTTAPITNYIPALQTAAANVARFDHDPVTGESKGLLIEEQRTNLLTYSDRFDNAVWTKTNATVTANAVVAPDGTLTADKLVENTASTNEHRIYQSASLTSGTNYTWSVYAKAGERSWIAIQTFDGSTRFNFFNLANGTVGTTASGNTSTITPVGNGWYKCTTTRTAATTGTGYFVVHLATGDTSNDYTGDGYSGIYIWGAQLEAGSFPTSYIPTVASQVTRSADSASMTGSNFSSWYRADEGTLYVESQKINTASSGYTFIAAITDGTSANAIYTVWGNANNFIYSEITASNVGQAQIGYYNMSQTAAYKTAVSYKVNDFAFTQNASNVQTDTSGVVPVVTKIDIGCRNSGSYLNGTIKRIAFWPKRLTNAELVGITS